MSREIRILRKEARPIPPSGSSRAGAARIDITPHLGLPLAGYSSEGQRAKGMVSRLWARALYLEDAQGNAVVFCGLDAHGATRYLHERIATQTAEPSGISVDRLVLFGTHTHTGPGQFYGNRLYDTFAQRKPGFDQTLADWIAARAARAVDEAVAAAQPASFGRSVRTVWGLHRNRSHVAHLLDPEASHWNEAGFPGHDAPSDLSVDERAVDPRLTVLAAFAEGSDVPLGVLTTFGAHATSLGPELAAFGSDWPGEAARRSELALAAAGQEAVVMVGLSGAGDVNTLVTGSRAGLGRAREVGTSLSRAIAAGIDEAAQHASAFEIDVRYDQWAVAHGEKVLNADASTRLADRWMFGASTLAGSEEGPSVLRKQGLAWEGMTSDFYGTDDPQHPKAPALGALGPFGTELFALEPSPVLPLHVVRVGEHVVATVPGEPTTVAAYRIERAVEAALSDVDVTVLGYAGDYSGYFTTEEEYGSQQYEGASTIYGRNSSHHLALRLAQMANRPSETPSITARTFVTMDEPSLGFQPNPMAASDSAHDLELQRVVHHVVVTWKMRADIRIVFGNGVFAWLEGGAALMPGEPGRKPYDDQHMPLRVWRQDKAFFLDERCIWTVTVTLPRELRDQAGIHFRVAASGGFEGLDAVIPPPA